MSPTPDFNPFLDHLSAELRCSPHTVSAYRRDLEQFAGWSGLDPTCPGEVKAIDIRGWIGELAEGGMKPTSLRRKIQSLRGYFKWGMRQGIFDSNPANDVTLPKKRKHLPNYIKEEEVEDLLAGGEEDFKSARSRIIIEILYTLGLRRAELLALTDADLNLYKGEMRITGKRNKQRVVPIPESLRADLERWIRIRDERYPGLPQPAAIAAGPHGALSPNQLHLIVKEALEGVSSGRKSPHTLRHTFATSMINNGADLDAVRELLGHESLATTQIYTHLSIKELLAGYETAHPRGHKQVRNDQKEGTDRELKKNNEEKSDNF